MTKDVANQNKDSQSILRCPVCYEGLALGALSCEACTAKFLELGSIPWIFRDGDQLLFEWKERLKSSLQNIEERAQSTAKELQNSKLSALTKRRLELLRDANIHQGKLMRRLLEPLAMSQTGSYDLSQGLRVKVPVSQSLTGYYPNVHRDWCWGDEENSKSKQMVLEHLPVCNSLTRMAFFGAGACRLPYDIHNEVGPAVSVALDINPLLMFIAKKMLTGESVELYEFPIAPRDISSHAVMRELKAQAPVNGNFHLLFADAMNPPFCSGSLDVAVTPWFIDVIPQDLAHFLPRVNRCLKMGGHWVNFGTLGFGLSASAKRYSYEEVLEIAELSGFAIEKQSRQKIPYLASPLSCHSRMEEVLCFRAKKIRDVDQPKDYKYLPDWITNDTIPIPVLPSLASQVISLRVFAEVSAMVDGKRNLQQIAKEFARAYRMTIEEALPSVRGFFTRIYEEQIYKNEF